MISNHPRGFRGRIKITCIYSLLQRISVRCEFQLSPFCEAHLSMVGASPTTHCPFQEGRKVFVALCSNAAQARNLFGCSGFSEQTLFHSFSPVNSQEALCKALLQSIAKSQKAIPPVRFDPVRRVTKDGTLQALLKCPEVEGAATEMAASMADKAR